MTAVIMMSLLRGPRPPGLSRSVPAGRQRGQLPEADQADVFFENRPADPIVTQRPQLLFPLRGVARWKSWLDVAGMTVQFGHALAHLDVEHSEKAVDANLFEVG